MEIEVKGSSKDNYDNIIGLCGPDPYTPGLTWKKNSRQIISDIESQSKSYYVHDQGHKVYVEVVNRISGKYLRTEKDCSRGNNLDELPACR